MMCNGEGYPDPTASAAITNVMKENPFVYICMRARNYCKFAVARGKIPLAPHLYFPQFMSETAEREAAMRMNFELLKLCGELWVFGENITEGMAAEIARSKKVRYFTTKCEEVHHESD